MLNNLGRKYGKTSSAIWRNILTPLKLSVLLISVVVVTGTIKFLTNGRTGWTSPVVHPRNVSLSSHFAVPGLGNTLFQYASLYGMARESNRVAVVPRHILLARYFPDLRANVSGSLRPGLSWGKLVENHASRYDGVIVDTATVSDENLELVGYFQSWYYFRGVEREIREQFEFSPNVSARVKTIRRGLGVDHDGADSGDPGVLVGIHVRRGDMLMESVQKFGYTVADGDYLERAMAYFENINRKVRYLVASNDVTWCRQEIRTKGRQVWIVRNTDPMVDLALLASCDHVIMTVGTFGWWAGWLAGGQVVYYKNFPRPGSNLEKSFSPIKTDYYPEHWIGL